MHPQLWLRVGATLTSMALGALSAVAQEPPKPVPVPEPEEQVSVGHKVGQQIPAFEVQTRDAKNPEADPKKVSSRDKKARLYISMGTRCPGVNLYASRIQKLDKEVTKKGVEVIYLYPNYNETIEAKQEFHAKKAMPSRWADDENAAVVFGKLRGKKTAEAIFVDPEGVIRYRGGFDDNRSEDKVTRRYVSEAVAAWKDGKIYDGPMPKAPG